MPKNEKYYVKTAGDGSKTHVYAYPNLLVEIIPQSDLISTVTLFWIKLSQTPHPTLTLPTSPSLFLSARSVKQLYLLAQKVCCVVSNSATTVCFWNHYMFGLLQGNRKLAMHIFSIIALSLLLGRSKYRLLEKRCLERNADLSISDEGLIRHGCW